MAESLENNGGESGGPSILRLKRSELAILRRMADRYPITQGEREEVVEIVMNTLRTAETPRNKIAAAQAMIALDRVNIEEVKTYVAAKKAMASELRPASVTNVNVSVTNANVNARITDPKQLAGLSEDELLRLHRETLGLPEPASPSE